MKLTRYTPSLAELLRGNLSQRYPTSFLIRSLYTLLVFILTLPCVHAEDYIPPHLVKITTPRYQPTPELANLRLGTYEYAVGWEGINAASCTVTVERQGDSYVIESSARTYSGVDLLYKLRYTAT